MEKEQKKTKKKLEKQESDKTSGTKNEISWSKVSTRGRTFEGYVTKKFSDRIVLEFERTVFIKKYERFMKKKTRLHAKLPSEINVEVGDLVKVRECRPLSKIIHFIVINKVRS